MMMRRLWLAVVLGVILGLGATAAPSSIGSEEKVNVPLVTSGTQRTFETILSPWMQFQFVLLGLLAGLVVAVPVFLLIKHRNQSD